MQYVMNRNLVVASVYGHALRFVKGEPLEVPPLLVPQVVAAGGIPAEDVPEEQQPKTPSEPADPIEREKAMFGAFETVATRNKTGDFTAGGTPRVSAVEKELGWKPEAAEIEAAWTKFKVGPTE